jgi:phytoene synthase
MEMDLTITEYQNYEALLEYVYGSAAVIGLEMVPVLGYSDQRAFEAAKKLGIAFQLANFIRDVSEDLDRGRVYLPLDELARFGVDRAMLERRVLTPEIVEALKFQIARVRSLQEEADIGIEFLDKESRPCIRAASELYCGIVDEVEAIGYDIFNKRAKTSTARRARVAGIAYLQAITARIR